MARQKTYDAIVIGAGPGGSTAARYLAQEGRHTLVLDAQPFPRRKVCGGGVTGRTAALLADLDLSPVIDDTTERFILGHGRRRVAVLAPQPFVYQVRRHRFDNFLLAAAVAAGAEARTGEPVTQIEERSAYVEVATDAGTYRAPYVVAADGARGVTAQRLGASPLRRWCGAVEWEYPITAAEAPHWSGSLEFAFGAADDGYAWVFPKDGHWSVGVCTLRPQAVPLRKALLQYMESHGLDTQRDGTYRSAAPLAISVGGQPTVLHTGRVLFVGDAAGLTDPFSGEGIYYAVASGKQAAQALLAQKDGQPNLTLYADSLAKHLLPELKWSWRLARTFYPFGGWLLNNLVTPARTGFAQLLAALARGEADYRQVSKAVPGVLLRRGRGRHSADSPAVEVVLLSDETGAKDEP